jgi:hypothetical protein
VSSRHPATSKQRQSVEPDPRHVDRDDVRVATNRCPYCHDDVAVHHDDWVACWTCQARHHRACWQESARCGACGETRCVAEAAGTAAGEPARIEDPGSIPVAAVAGLACYIAGCLLFVADVVLEVAAVDSLALVFLLVSGSVLLRFGARRPRHSPTDHGP